MLRRVPLLALLALACVPGVSEGPPPAPEVEAPAQDAWVEQEYAPVQKQAAELSVDDFLGLYPLPNYLDKLSFDPLTAAGLEVIRPYAGLTSEHDVLLAKNGFVAASAGAPPTFAATYLDIYDHDLPVLITSDSLLHALHKSFDAILKDFEYTLLRDELAAMLAESHDALGQQLAALPPELTSAALDLDVYLSVARALLTGSAEPVSGDPDVKDKVQRILTAAAGLQPLDLELFGVSTLYDFSQLAPRGHYEGDSLLESYFQAMIWLGRTDLPIVLFDEQQNPLFNRRGLAGAFLLNLMLESSGAAQRWQRIDKTIGLLIGERDSMSPRDMTTFAAALDLGTPADFVAATDEVLYKALIDGDYGLQRIMSQIMFTDPSDPPLLLPRVFHTLGQRFTIDSHVFNNVTYDRVQDLRTGTKVTRMLPSEFDLHFALGDNAAGHHLGPELDKYGYQGVLHELRFLIDSHPQDFWDGSFYNGWLAAIRALSDTSDFAERPEAMRTAAWADKTIHTEAAAWSELRHDTLLYVKQSYSGGNACEYPDAFVEPVPAFYERLAHLGVLGQQLSDQLAGEGFQVTRAQAFFAHLSSVSATLATIAQKELDQQALSQAEYDFLRGAIEVELVGCGTEQYDGWYGRLFYDPAKIVEFEPTIADVHTAPTDEAGDPTGWVLHAATGRPMLLVFTMADCSGSRAYVGPVSSFHSVLSENFERQTDSDWATRFEGGATPPRPPWTSSFIR